MSIALPRTISTVTVSLIYTLYYLVCTGDCLRCLCQSSINGVRVSPFSAECDGGTTCTIPESSSKGECYKEVLLHAESGAVIVTHSCAYMDRYDVTLNTACTNRSGEMACCSNADYCNAHLSLSNAPRGQSASHEDASTMDQGSGKPTVQNVCRSSIVCACI